MAYAAMALVLLIVANTFRNAYYTATEKNNWFGAILIGLLGLVLTAISLFQLFFRR